MTENAANVCAYLKQKHPSCTIIYNANISYINTLVEPTVKITFVCKEDKARLKSIENTISPSVVEKGIASLDLTGSPLKDECDIDVMDMSEDFKLPTITPWLEFEEAYKGIDIQKCRNILNDLDLQKLGARSNSALWILCNAEDDSKTVFQTLEFNEKNCRGIVFYKGIRPAKSINANDLVKAHLSKIRGSTKVETNIDSFFVINPCMTLKLTSSTNSVQPNINDFRYSETILFQNLKTGDIDSPAEDFWRELCILSNIKNDIVDYKKNGDDRKDIIYRCGSGIEPEILREKLIGEMTSLPSFDPDSQTDDSSEIEAVIHKAKTRRLLDLTDKLWEILKCCSSYKDLKAGFHIIFQCAAKRSIVNPPTNNNRLAEIIREVSDHRLAIPCLTGSEPLELLLEIGLEKLAKDYEYIFTESKICGVNDLQINKSPNKDYGANVGGSGDSIHVRKSLHAALQANTTSTCSSQQRTTLLHTNNLSRNEENDVIGFQNSKFSKRDIEYKLSRLAQIHLALEHLLHIQVTLNLENVYNQICQQLLNRPLQTFDAIKGTLFDRIKIPISTDSIISRLEGKDPHARRIVMASKNNFKEIESTYYYNMENIFPPSAFTGIESEEKEFSRENVYYCWEYLKISTRRH